MLLPVVLLTTCKTADEPKKTIGKDINPYAAGLNKWIQEKNESSLDLTFSKTEGNNQYCRGISGFTLLRAWGLTHHLSELRDPELIEWHKEKLATEIEYLLDVAEHYNGRFIARGAWNVERFVL